MTLLAGRFMPVRRASASSISFCRADGGARRESLPKGGQSAATAALSFWGDGGDKG